MGHRQIGVCLAIAVLAAVASATAQTVGPQMPPLVIRSLVGKDSFDFYCASCHGREADGKGRLAATLAVAPPDLRFLARRNGGEFPRARVTAFVTDGDPSASAHPRTEMPPWGAAFASLERSDALVPIRIANIVQYLETLQVK